MPFITSSPSVHLWPLPQQWEKFGFFLPRFLLDWAEIHAFPATISDISIDQDIDFWRSRKIALVKQTAYHALYPRPGKGSWEETVLSSQCHLGPFSFLADLGADYHVFAKRKSRKPFSGRKNKPRTLILLPPFAK